MPGSISGGVAISIATKRPRKAAADIRPITCSPFQTGQTRYGAAYLFQLVAPRSKRGLPHSRPICAFFRPSSQVCWLTRLHRLGVLGERVVPSCINFRARIWQFQYLVGAAVTPTRSVRRSIGQTYGSDPRTALRGCRLKCVNGSRFLHGQANVIQAVHQAMLLECVDFKGKTFAI